MPFTEIGFLPLHFVAPPSHPMDRPNTPKVSQLFSAIVTTKTSHSEESISLLPGTLDLHPLGLFLSLWVSFPSSEPPIHPPPLPFHPSYGVVVFEIFHSLFASIKELELPTLKPSLFFFSLPGRTEVSFRRGIMALNIFLSYYRNPMQLFSFS